MVASMASAGPSPSGDIHEGRTGGPGVQEEPLKEALRPGSALTCWGSSSKCLPSWVLVSRVRNREHMKWSEVSRTPNSGAHGLSSGWGRSLGPAECPGGRTAPKVSSLSTSARRTPGLSGTWGTSLWGPRDVGSSLSLPL